MATKAKPVTIWYIARDNKNPIISTIRLTKKACISSFFGDMDSYRKYGKNTHVQKACIIPIITEVVK